MTEVIWGSIGCGDVFTRKSGPPLSEVAHSRLAGVYRRDATACAMVATRHVCRAYASVDELLGDPTVSAVYIATHPPSHEQYTLAAAAAGKHVLVEKEMAVDAAACQRMIAACAAAGVVLAVAFYRRCYPTMLRCRALLDEGAIGALRRLAINDQFPLSHRLDLAHFLGGDAAAVAVSEQDLAPDSNAARGPVLTVRHRDGATTVMNVGWHESGPPETVRIEGERGSIAVHDLKGGRMRVTVDGVARDEVQGGLPWTHTGLVENMVQALRGEARLACDGVEGRKSQVIEDLVRQTPTDGSWQTVVY